MKDEALLALGIVTSGEFLSAFNYVRDAETKGKDAGRIVAIAIMNEITRQFNEAVEKGKRVRDDRSYGTRMVVSE